MPFKLVRLETFKYPAIERYFLPTALVSDTAEHLLLYHPAGGPTWQGSTARVFRSTMHSMAVLSPGKDYNTVLFWNPDWTFSSYYVNVALPVEWDGELCSYIDLDLDVLYVTENSRREPDDYAVPGVYELDRDEFDEHKVVNAYPQEIIDRAEAALVEVQQLIARKEFPFDDSLLSWRPDPAMLSLAELPDSGATWHHS